MGDTPKLPYGSNALADVGTIAMLTGKYDAAEECFRRAIERDPSNEESLANYALLCRISNRFDEALELVEQCLKANPRSGPAFMTFASVCEDLGRFQEALKGYAMARKLMPANRSAALGLATSLMRLQRFQEAWVHWEYARYDAAWFPVPGLGIWDGQAPAGKRILVLREGGYGDGIMFARWVQLLKDLGADVTYFVWDSLHPVLKPLGVKLLGEKDVIEINQYDFCCSALSLPALMGMASLDDIPPCPPLGVSNARQHVTDIGICWAAEENSVNRKHRSVPVEQLQGLRLDGPPYFYSLCPGQQAPPWMLDLTPNFTDWGKTAEFVAGLDLVITVDTAIAHLAGAMGVPTWVLVPMRSDWKWFVGRDDSLWYPSARLFRQEDPVDWASAIQRVAGEMGKLV